MGWLQVLFCAFLLLLCVQLRHLARQLHQLFLSNNALRYSLLSNAETTIAEYCSSHEQARSQTTPPLCPTKIEWREAQGWQSVCVSYSDLDFRAPRYYKIESNCTFKFWGEAVQVKAFKFIMKR